MRHTRAKTWAAILATILVLPGCQAARTATAPAPVSATQPLGASRGLAVPLALETSTATGYQPTGCMDFGMTPALGPAGIAILILAAPVALVVGVPYLMWKALDLRRWL